MVLKRNIKLCNQSKQLSLHSKHSGQMALWSAQVILIWATNAATDCDYIDQVVTVSEQRPIIASQLHWPNSFTVGVSGPNL